MLLNDCVTTAEGVTECAYRKQGSNKDDSVYWFHFDFGLRFDVRTDDAPNENKISYRRSAARRLPVGLRVRKQPP